MPRNFTRPSLFALTATITATDTMRHFGGPLRGGVNHNKAVALDRAAEKCLHVVVDRAHNRGTWLLEIPSINRQQLLPVKFDVS